LRPLSQGDTVYEGEVVVTADGARVDLLLPDGTIYPVQGELYAELLPEEGVQHQNDEPQDREVTQDDAGDRSSPDGVGAADDPGEWGSVPVIQRTGEFSDEPSGYIRVAKDQTLSESQYAEGENSFAISPVLSVSIVGDYKVGLNLRAGGYDEFLDGRATYNPRIIEPTREFEGDEFVDALRIEPFFGGDERAPVINTVPEIGVPEDAAVYEEDLDEGNDDNPPKESTVVGGSLAVIPAGEGLDTTFDPGNEPPLGLESAGQQVQYYISPDGHTLIGYVGSASGEPDESQWVFTVVINNPGSDAGAQSYTFTLLDQLDHPQGDGENQLDLSFSYTVRDESGDEVGSVFNVTVVDDVPTARPDADSVTEDGPLSASGNVVNGGDPLAEDDTIGADNDGVDPVTGVAAGSDTSSAVIGDVGTIVTGTYGSVVIAANGDYTYTLDNMNTAVQGLTEGESLTDTFVYTITDADGDQSTMTLTITIQGADDGTTIVIPDNNGPSGGGEETVYEAGLDDGSNPGESDVVTSSFTITAPDGLASITVVDGSGMDVVITESELVASETTYITIDTEYGTLVINGYTPNASTGGGEVQYTYSLDDNTLNHTGAGNDTVLDSIAITVTDTDGDTSNDTLDIEIVDDVPSNISPDDTFMANTAETEYSAALDFFGNIGADGPGTVRFDSKYDGAYLLDTDGDPVTSEGAKVLLQLSPDGTVLTGYKESSTPGVPSTFEVIRITLEPDGVLQSNDTYKVELFARIDDGSWTDFNNFNAAPAGNNNWIGLDSDGISIDVPDSSDPNPLSQDLVITAISSADSVNRAATDIGVDNQWIDPSEGLRFDFVINPTKKSGYDENNTWQPNNSNDFPFTTDGYYEATSFEFVLPQVKSTTADIRISAYFTADSDPNILLEPADVDVFISKNDLVIESTATYTITQVGNDVIIRGLEAGDKVYFSTSDDFNRVEISNEGSGQQSFSLGGFSIGSPVPGSPVPMDFDLVVTDEGGDTAAGEFTVTLDSPVFVVGKNVDDVDGETESHAVPNPNLESSGEIVGGGANDILIGDIGGSSVQGKDNNIILVLDTSGSMSTTITFQGQNISRMQALKNSVNALLSELAQSDAENVRVAIIEYNGTRDGFFSTNPDSHLVGTYDLRVDGVVQETALNSANQGVNALQAGGGTNYEAGLQEAIDWVDAGSPITGENVVNQVVFISDGVPTFYYSGDGRRTAGDGGDYDPDALAHIVGGGDSVNEVTELESIFGPIEAIGISLSNTDLGGGLTPKGVLDQVEGSGGDADNITTAEQLSQVLYDLSPLNTLADVGGDVLLGGEGDDIILGDAPFTDILAQHESLSMNPGSGYLVFKTLEDDLTNDWTRASTIDYIRNNHAQLSTESETSVGLRGGGDDLIDGGGGRDIIYGQEGDDTIIYDALDFTIDGGSGFDTLKLENGDGIDFGSLVLNPIDNMEVIDLASDTNPNALTNLSPADVLDMTDGDNELYVLGDENDSVGGAGWTSSGSQEIGGVMFDVYTGSGATLYVQDEMNSTLNS